MCNCGRTTNTICTSSCQTVDCACPIKDLSTDCVLYTGEDLPCSEIKTGTLLTEAFGQLDTYLCDLSNQLANSFSLISVGQGTRVYKGVDGIGRKEIRSITPSNTIITVGLSTDDKEIEIGLDVVILKDFIQDNQITYSASNVGTGAGVYKNAIRTGDNVNLSFKRLKSQNGTITITEEANEIDFAVSVDGSETKVTAGTAISVSGTGTIASPYVVTNTAPDQVVAITGSGATTVSGSYPNFTVSSTDTDTTYSAGLGLYLSGTTFGVRNLQKVITGDYTLTNGDVEHTIFIDNGTSPVTITVPAGLSIGFEVGFVQEGTGLVTFVASGTTINTATGLKIKGQNYQAFLEKKLSSETFYLLGNVIA
jgi:hypothetical protein